MLQAEAEDKISASRPNCPRGLNITVNGQCFALKCKSRRHLIEGTYNDRHTNTLNEQGRSITLHSKHSTIQR